MEIRDFAWSLNGFINSINLCSIENAKNKTSSKTSQTNATTKFTTISCWWIYFLTLLGYRSSQMVVSRPSETPAECIICIPCCRTSDKFLCRLFDTRWTVCSKFWLCGKVWVFWDCLITIWASWGWQQMWLRALRCKARGVHLFLEQALGSLHKWSTVRKGVRSSCKTSSNCWKWPAVWRSPAKKTGPALRSVSTSPSDRFLDTWRNGSSAMCRRWARRWMRRFL